MDNPTMDDIRKLLRNSKYVVATASLFNTTKEKAEDVNLMGYSRKDWSDECFKRWNDGFTDFFYGVCVKDGRLVDECGRVLNVTYLSDCSRKAINERIRRGE